MIANYPKKHYNCLAVEHDIAELSYPLSFRREDCVSLGTHLLHRHNVNLVGMKRVGISNFLRFFLYRPDIVSEYISKDEKHLFILIDLNDLIEREVYPFWVLTFKRIIDTIERSDLPGVDKERLDDLFSDAIQSQDKFLLIDGVRKALITILDTGVSPTLFFLRFDRIKDVIDRQFFDNLQGLKDATHQKLSFVFTGYQSLDKLAPQVFTKADLSVFMHTQFVKPGKSEDMVSIANQFKTKYGLELERQTITTLCNLSGGHVQYLQLGLILFHEGNENNLENLRETLLGDERIQLLSEELWEGLGKSEQEVLLSVVEGKQISDEEKQKTQYLWDIGMVKEKNDIFSPLYLTYLLEIQTNGNIQQANVHFSKKEHMLFKILEEHRDEICEREDIVEYVWPEYSEYGVSDWAIDRLVARVRQKLKQQESTDEIITIRTRGYKLSSQ